MMSNITEAFKEGLKSIIPETRQRIQDNVVAEIDEACYRTQQEDIARAAAAMVEAGLTDSIIEKMLWKYWELRRGEIRAFLEWAHNQVSK